MLRFFHTCLCWRFCCIGLVSVFWVLGADNPARAEPPRLWDPGYRASVPDLSGIQRLRFLTSLDFPPFNYADASRKPTGFNVDLARAICDHLELTSRCEIEAMPWEELEPALEAGLGEVILAGTAPSAEKRTRFGLSEPYFRFPGRFAARRDAVASDAGFRPALATGTVAVASGSAHAAMLASHFPDIDTIQRDTVSEVYAALIAGEADFVFGDGVALSFWLASPSAANCCEFVSGPYMSQDYFGLGMVAVTRISDENLLDAINAALKSIEDRGVYARIYARYFPIDPFGR